MRTVSTTPGSALPACAFRALAGGAVVVLALCAEGTALAQPSADEVSRVRSLVAAGQLDRASAVVDEWTARYPNDLDARAWHARLLAWTNRWSAAEAAYRELLASQPDDVDLLGGLADVLFWQRRGEEALVPIDRACMLDPTRADIRLRRAQILEQLGRSDEARSAFEETLAREPASTEASKGLERLRPPGRYDVRVGSDVDYLPETSNGGVVLASLGVRWDERWSGRAAVAQYARFGETATRVAAEATRRFRGADVLTVGAGIAPDQDIVPREEVQVEYGHGLRANSKTFLRGLEATWQQRFLWYQDAKVLILTPGLVLYLPKDWIWLVRVSASRVGVTGIGSEWRASGWTRLTVPLRPTLDGFALLAVGAETYGYRDQLLGFTAQTAGGGLRWRFGRGQEVSAYGQYQHRSNGQTQISIGTTYDIRF
jgi:YaiO family outer membrane protein